MKTHSSFKIHAFFFPKEENVFVSGGGGNKEKPSGDRHSFSKMAAVESLKLVGGRCPPPNKLKFPIGTSGSYLEDFPMLQVEVLADFKSDRLDLKEKTAQKSGSSLTVLFLSCWVLPPCILGKTNLF